METALVVSSSPSLLVFNLRAPDLKLKMFMHSVFQCTDYMYIFMCFGMCLDTQLILYILYVYRGSGKEEKSRK